MNLEASRCKWFILVPEVKHKFDVGICSNPDIKTCECVFITHSICHNYAATNGYWGPKQEALLRRLKEVNELEELYDKSCEMEKTND